MFASPPVAALLGLNCGGQARPEAGEMSIAPYKQCGVRRAKPENPEYDNFEKAIHFFEGLWKVFETRCRVQGAGGENRKTEEVGMGAGCGLLVCWLCDRGRETDDRVRLNTNQCLCLPLLRCFIFSR